MNTTKQVTLRQQLNEFEKGNYLDSSNHLNSGCFNFFDWFCKETSLERKSKKLFKAVKIFSKKFNVDLDKHYVFFKNNCPMNGPLYDSFSICSIENGDVEYWVTPKSGHTGQAEIVKSPNFGEPLYTANSLREIYKTL